MVDPELVAIGAEAPARLTDLGVMPEPALESIIQGRGASLTMIDRHYGHLARAGSEHAIRLLDALSAGQRPRWTLVEAKVEAL